MATTDDSIVSAAIHPSIGVARIGNSESAFTLAPEVPNPCPEEPGFYRDETGALKRQAARFRVYGLNAHGRIVRELTSDEAEITWSVHLANQKSSWYEFQLALDIPEAASAPPTNLRNAGIEDRSALTIDPGARQIQGPDQGGGAEQRFDTGTFMGQPVYLGELQTDEAGRLVVLGGRGVSASYNDSRAITFANNDTWYDDTADGPVRAEVRLKGQLLAVEPAWVIVAPPNYGPARKSVRTMWDLMRDVAIQSAQLTRPVRPSFREEIQPIFERLAGLQWVNAGFAAAFGWKGPFNLATPERLAELADPSPSTAELRRTLANQFRDFDRDGQSPIPWPWVYGDAMSLPPAGTPRQNAVLSATQMWALDCWAKGEFSADYDPNFEPPRTLREVPVEDQGVALDRASLEFCLAEAFHPGCEMTWPVRAPMMYSGPFRFAHAPLGWKQPDYGSPLSQTALYGHDGPLGPQTPGSVTRWMAVPWQTDTASCRSGYVKSYDPYLPTFWAPRVPNQVLTERDYEIVMDGRRPLDERLTAFARRAAWTRRLGKHSSLEQLENMILHFDRMGIVEVREGPPEREHFPAKLEVEDSHADHVELLGDAVPIDPVDFSNHEKYNRFPHGLR